MSLLQKDETLSASTEVHASAEQVYAVVSDVTRIPERSPETTRAEWLTASTSAWVCTWRDSRPASRSAAC
jgi:ribosome-associated toxin RatA of RatAB toxin-antitoxin module